MKYETMKEIVFMKGTEQKILERLQNYQSIDFIDLLDDKKNTALHYAVSLEYRKVIIKYFQLLEDSKLWDKKFPGIVNSSVKHKIKVWVNSENSESLTPIHYASLKGSIKIAQILEDKGARLNKTTNSGLNVFSLAVQYGKIQSMIYFRGKTDTNATDNNNCTALHWACYKGHEAIARYLISQNQMQLDFQQNQGRTSLHIAVIYGFERIVKLLLLNGANRMIKDNQRKTPKDYAQQLPNQQITKMLTLKQKRGCFQGSYTYAPKKKQGCGYIVLSFMLIYIIVVSNFILNVLPLFKTATYNLKSSSSPFIYSQYILGTELICTTIGCFLAFFIRCRKITKQLLSLTYLIENKNNANKFCFLCRTDMSDGIEHCPFCNECIPIKIKHDHLIGRCIGSHNIKFYLSMLISLAIVLIFCIIMGVSLVNYQTHEEMSVEYRILFLEVVFIDLLCLIPLVLIIYQIWNTVRNICRLSQIMIEKQLSETTLDSRSTLVANKISRVRSKHNSQPLLKEPISE